MAVSMTSVGEAWIALCDRSTRCHYVQKYIKVPTGYLSHLLWMADLLQIVADSGFATPRYYFAGCQAGKHVPIKGRKTLYLIPLARIRYVHIVAQNKATTIYKQEIIPVQR
jgi:hypothetical protein